MCVQLFRYVWNAKLTETQIFRELSIEIESSLLKYKCIIIERTNRIKELSILIRELSISFKDK